MCLFVCFKVFPGCSLLGNANFTGVGSVSSCLSGEKARSGGLGQLTQKQGTGGETTV